MNRNLLGFLSATALLLAAPFAAAEDNDSDYVFPVGDVHVTVATRSRRA